MERGEIWVVALPFSSEREQSGERPAIVLQDASFGQKSLLAFIALLTSQQSALRFPATVLIQTYGSQRTDTAIRRDGFPSEGARPGAV